MKILVTKNEMMNIAKVVERASYNAEEVFEAMVQETEFAGTEDLLEMRKDLSVLRSNLREQLRLAEESNEETLELEIPESVMIECLKKAGELDSLAAEAGIEIVRVLGKHFKRIKMLADYIKASITQWCNILIKPTDEEVKDSKALEVKLEEIGNKIKAIISK